MNFRSLLSIRAFRRLLAGGLAAVLAAEPALATFAEPGRAPDVPVVRIIQDIHAHPEAQRSIADALARAQRETGRDLRVGVEGAAGPFDFSPYYAFPDESLRRSVSSQLLDESRIAGPVYAALCRRVFRLVGIEDPALYRENVHAYLAARAGQPALLKAVAARAAGLAARKAVAFDAPLARFDAKVSAYRAGDLPFGDYLEAVAEAAGDTGFVVEQFLVAHRMERAIDFRRVEAERKTFVERLVRSLSADDVAQVRRWIEGLGEDSGAGRRFEFLFHAARARGVDLSAFPALTDYVRYLRLSEGVDPDRLFTEAAEAEEAAYRRLANGSTSAAALIAEARRLSLTTKLLRFEMTHADWRAYQDLRAAGSDLPEADLRPFEDFYRVAARRDVALAERARRGQLDAIVVGGFHTEGLTAAFRAAGVPFEIVRPRITSALPGDATAYLSVFAAEKTPLERLFARFRLFLAPPAVIGVPAPLVSSRNDDAPARFAAKYRLAAASKPELAPAVAAASEDLDAVLHRADDRLARLSRPNTRWLTESLFLLPLAVGLAVGDGGLSAAGLAVQLFGLPLAHLFTVDRVAASPARRFGARVVWSAAFLGVYGAALLVGAALGLPLSVGAGLALLPAAWSHRLNHVAIRFPGSVTAALLFDRLRLPVLRMSTGDELSAAEMAVILAYAAPMRAAIDAWVARSDALDPSVEEDPVTEYIAEVERDLASHDDDYVSTVVAGLAKAIVEARLSPERLRMRAARDYASSGSRTLRLSRGSPVHRVNGRLIQLVYRGVKSTLGPGSSPESDAVDLGHGQGVERGFVRMTRDAIAQWRAKRGTTLLSGDNDIDEVLEAAAEVSSVAATNRNIVTRAVKRAYLDAKMTNEELSARARRDTARRGSVMNRTNDGIEGAVWAQVTNDLTKTPGAYEAISSGVLAGTADIARREFAEVLSRWNVSARDPMKRNPNEILQFFEQVTRDSRDDSERLMFILNGTADAWVGAKMNRDEQVHLSYTVFLYAFSRWVTTTASRDPVLSAVTLVLGRVGDSDATVEELIKIGREQAWREAMRGAGRDSVRRRTGQTGVKAPLPADLVRRIIPVMSDFGLRVATTADAVAEGMMSENPSTVDTIVLVGELLMPILEAPPFRDDVSEFSVTASIVNGIFTATTGTTREAVGAALDEYFHPSRALERLLPEWKAKVGDAGLDRRIRNVWMRVPNLRKRADASGTAGTDEEALVKAMEDADLTPDQLVLRAQADLSTQIFRFLKRDLDDSEAYWPDHVQDPAIQSVVAAYIALARRYHARGDGDRVQAIFEGLGLAVNEPFEMGGQFESGVYRHKYTLPLRDIGYAALEMEQWEAALVCGRLIASSAEPAFEMPEIVGWTYDLMGSAYFGRGDPDSAMHNGYEYATAMQYNERAIRTLPASDWARFMERVMRNAFLFDRQGGHTASSLFYAWMLEFLDRNPAVRADLVPGLEARLRALAAAATVATSARPAWNPATGAFDPASLARLRVQAEIFDEQGLTVMKDTTLSQAERNSFLNAGIDVNTEAAFLGDPSRVARVRGLAELMYAEEPLLALDAELRAKRNLAIALPAQRARLFREIDEAYAKEKVETMPIDSINAALFVESYGMHLAVKGDPAAAEQILRRVDTEVQSPAFHAILVASDKTPTAEGQQDSGEAADRVIGRIRPMILTQLAGVMSGRGASAADIAVPLGTAFTMEGYDPRVIPDLHRFLEPTTFREDLLLDAAGLVLSAPERAGQPLEARLKLAEWCRSFSPAGTAARRAAWTESKRQRAVGRAIGARFALLDSVGPGEWPAPMLLRLDHERQLRHREEEYEKALEGLNTKVRDEHETFLKRWGTPRLFTHLYAGMLAGAGLGEESLEAVRLARRLTQDGVKKFVPGAKIRAIEDMGILLFPTHAGNHALTVDEASRELRPDDENKMSAAGPAVLAAAEQLGNQEFKTARDMAKALDAAVRLVERLKSGLPPTVVNFVLGRLYALQGDMFRAIDLIAKAMAEGDGESSWTVRAISESAAFAMRDPRRLLPSRLDESARLSAVARENLEHDRLYVGCLELVVAMYRFNPADPGAAASLARRAVDLLSLARSSNRLSRAFNMRIPARLADVATIVGPSSSGEIMDALADLRSFVGPKVGELELAIRSVGAPDVFLAWSDTDRAGEQSAEWTAARLTAAQQAGQVGRAAVEAERLVDVRPERYSDAYWISYVVDLLMDSPRSRAAYLDTVTSLLTRFEPGQWAGKDRLETLRRLIEVAARLGDANIVYLMDTLSENKAFPLKDLLVRPNTGLLARAEPSLDAEEWIERITRMEHINPSRMAALQKLAEARMSNDAARERLRALLAEKQSGFEARQAAARLVQEARGDYRGLDLAKAREKLNSIDARFRNADWTEIMAQVNRLGAVWDIYQAGDFEAARDALGAFPPSDPAPTIFRNRIDLMLEARRNLDDHRPQSAEVILNSINGTLKDGQKAEMEAAIQRAYRDANAAFEKMKTAANALPGQRAALNDVRAQLAAALKADAEFESIMRYLVTKAQTMISLGKVSLAEELLTILAEESRLFQPDFGGYGKLADVRRQFDRFRALARATYLIDWLNVQTKVLRAEYAAREHLAGRSRPGDPSAGGVEKQVFHLGEWEITDGGLVVVSSLNREVSGAKEATPGQPVLEAVPLQSTEFFQTNANFQLAFPLPGDGRATAAVTFLRRDRDNKLVFAADPSAVETIRQMQRLGRKAGTMRYVADISLQARINAMDETMSYLRRQMDALQDDRSLSMEFRVLNRLLGLDVSPQPSEGFDSGPEISDRFRGDPSQLAAIQAAVHPLSEVTAIQGPPGTGKTSTAVEISRLLTSGSPSRPGRVIVMTSQAHAGVDNIGLRLKAAGITVIRSASQSAQEKVARDLQTEEVETATRKSRLDQLMAAIEAREATGAGFVYLATNNGLRGDRKTFALLSMYLSGAPLSEIRQRWRFYTRRTDGRAPKGSERDETARKPVRPVWGQEEAGQANASETLAIAWAVRPDKAFLFGDQDQLAPHPIDEGVQRLVQQEVREGLKLPEPMGRIFTAAANAATETSLFEVSYAYANKWSHLDQANGGGVLLRFLSLARRSVWVITASIVNVFYGDRLRHRDQSKDEKDWERIRKDTVVFVNSSGHEVQSGESEATGESTPADGNAAISRGKSRINFTEVGEVIRAATYHLNGRAPTADRRRRQAGDILILTPYRGQNRLINETLRVMATLNDLAAGETVTADELTMVSQVLMRHAADARFRGRDQLPRLIARLRSGNVRGNVRELLETLKPMYDLVYEGDIQITRADLPEIKVETPAGEDSETEETKSQEGLDEQNANVIEAKTVHSVQGQERKVVIVSLVRSDSLGFLDDSRGQKTGRRIINVALSRVEDQLVVIYSRGKFPKSIGEMIDRLKTNFARQKLTFEPMARFPSRRAEMASLRSAWNVSFGSAARDRFVDTKIAPFVETGAFLALLGVGLMHGDAVVTLFGILLKAVVFPLLHFLPGWLGVSPDAPTPEQIARLGGLSAGLTVLYMASFGLLTMAMVSPVPAMFLAMVPVLIRHYANNAEADRAVTAPPAAPLELDTLSGLSAERPSRLAAELVPPIQRAKDPRIPDVRAANSGA